MEAVAFVGSAVPIQKFREARLAVRDTGADVVLVCPTQSAARVRALAEREGAPCDVVGYDAPWEIVPLLAAELGRFHAVAPLSEEVVVPTAVACERMGLRGPGVQAANLSRRKDLQRLVLSRWRLPFAQKVAHDGSMPTRPGSDQYPLIVKPVDASGSLGIHRAEHPRDLDRALAAGSGSRIVESLVTGPEFSVEAVVVDGTPVEMRVAAKFTNPGFIEIGQLTGDGAVPPLVEASLKVAAGQLVTDAAVQDAFVHAEFLVPTGKAPVLVEFACRPPGDALMLLHSLARGRDLGTDWVLSGLMSDRQPPVPLVPVPVVAPTAAGQRYLVHAGAGQFDGVTSGGTAVRHLAEGDLWPTLEETCDHEELCLVHLARGTRAEELSSSFTRIASVLATGRTAESVMRKLDRLELRARPTIGPAGRATPTSASGSQQD